MDRRFKPVFLKRKSDGENKVRKEVVGNYSPRVGWSRGGNLGGG